MRAQYTADIAGDQVSFTLTAVNDPSLDNYTSEDGFLTLRRVRGGCDGWLGYGGLCITFDDRHLPITVTSPHYEHASDLDHVMDAVTRELAVLNSLSVLPEKKRIAPITEILDGDLLP